MKINFLKADNGDSILIGFNDNEGQNRNILIDGGTASTYEYRDRRGKRRKAGVLQTVLENLKAKGEKIDLLIITHVDDDHIGGILKWFSRDDDAPGLIGKIWFNSGRLISEYFKVKEIKENLLEVEKRDGLHVSVKQGDIFEDYIERHKIWDRRLIVNKSELYKFGARFLFLSPNEEKLLRLLTKWKKDLPDIFVAARENDYCLSLKEHLQDDSFEEDDAVHNGSSIAFIFEHDSKKILFLGDAHPSLIIEELKRLGYSRENPLKVDLIKLSHHGSKANTNYEFLELIDCDAFVISSNGDRHNLPDKKCLARIISLRENVCLYFNYPEMIERIFSEQDFADYRFQALSAETEFIL